MTTLTSNARFNRTYHKLHSKKEKRLHAKEKAENTHTFKKIPHADPFINSKF